MRPRKQIVLLARTEAELRDWRFRLTVAGYAVTGAVTACSARESCREMDTPPEAVICVSSRNADIRYLQDGGRCKVLQVNCTVEEASESSSDAFVVRGPALMERVHDALKTMLARRRGAKREGGSTDRCREIGLRAALGKVAA